MPDNSYIDDNMGTNKKKFLIIIGFIFIIGVSNIQADDVLREWESFTSYNFVKEMISYDGYIWAATTGGLIRINPDDMSFETYTNIDGLQTNQLFCLYVDGQNRLWIGGRGQLINFTDPSNADNYLFTDRDGVKIDIFDIDGTPEGDSLWLASQAGLSLFLPNDDFGEGLIIDTYNRFGDIDRDTPANRVTLDDGNVWVATEKGLAIGSRDDVRLLKGPDGWMAYFPSDFSTLSNDNIRGLVSLNNQIYIGTEAGAYRFEQSVPELINLNLYGNPYIYNMTLIGDTILLNSSRGSTYYYNGNLYGLPTDNMPIPNTSGGAFDANGIFWNGNLINGVFYSDNGVMAPFDVGGMPSNDCRQIVFAQGKLWGVFWSAGLAYYDNDVWTKVEEVVNYVYCLGVGPLGEVWAGTWGGGVYRILDDSVMQFNYSNSALSGIDEAISFVVVTDIYNSGDAVWFANLRGRLGEVVAVNPHNLQQWQRYILTGGSRAEWVETIAVGQDVIYAGSSNNGIFARLYNGTPFDGNDDYTWKFTTTNSGIGSDIIQKIAIDDYDSMWVGTAFGLSHQALGEVIFENIELPAGFGPGITTIAFDGQGSLYAGSSQGLAIRDIGTDDITHLTSQNSGLVDDDINRIYYDAEGRQFWIATSSGLSRLRMPGALATTDVDEGLAYPNPFIIRYGDEIVRFNYAGISEVKIFSAAGELIKEIPVTGIWDGLNENGRPVASGLYFFTLKSKNGDIGRGKIFLVRE